MFTILPAPIAMICATVGFIVAFLSWQQHIYYKNVRKIGIETEGTVVEMRPDPGPLFGKAEGTGQAPTVEFTDQRGDVHRYICVCYQDPSPYKVGQKVKVWYHLYRSRREYALEDDQPGTGPMTMLKVGLVLLVLGAPELLKRLSGLF